jgi:hypothetical protein
MANKKGKKTIGVRVFKEDWGLLKKLAKREGRTFQNMFGVVVNVADKFRL